MALTNTQYNSVMREYDTRQIKNQHKFDKKLTEIYEQNNRFNEIDACIADLSLNQAKKLLNGDKNAVADLKNQIEKLSKEREELLNILGYSNDSLNMEYDCPDCYDTGYIGNQKCHCFKKTATDILYSQSNIKNILETENFDNYSFEYYNDSIKDDITGYTSIELAKKAVYESKRFIENFDKEFDNILLYGDTGVGKTFLSNCIAKELLDSAHSVIYFTAFEIFDLLAKNTFEKDEEALDVYDYLFDCDLLIIDDLGTECMNQMKFTELFNIINTRLLNQKHIMKTIISTNLSLKNLYDTYDERIVSRIVGNYNICYFFGDDIRFKKR